MHVAGLVMEYDSPTRLLENKSSSFAQLVAEYTIRSNANSLCYDKTEVKMTLHITFKPLVMYGNIV